MSELMAARPDVLNGVTYEIQLDHIDAPLYLTINHIKLRTTRYPYEVFINSTEPKLLEWSPVASRLISAVFRNGNNIDFIFKELQELFSYEFFFYKGKKYHSIVALIGEILEKHHKQLNTDKSTWE